MASFIPRYVSAKRPLDPKTLENRFYRSDLIVEGLRHDCQSYEGRVFINRPDADVADGRDPTKGYAGSYFIFGHPNCFGGPGHCRVPTHYRAFDKRPTHPLTPATKRVVITDALRQAANQAKEITIAIVPAYLDGAAARDVLAFERLQIALYD